MSAQALGRTGIRTIPIVVAALAIVFTTALPALALVPDRPHDTTTFDGRVRTIAYAGSTVYVGGTFSVARDASGAATRNNVAAIDAYTGQLLPWNPNANGAVWSIAQVGSSVYLGGNFTRVDGVYRRNFAKVNADQSAALDIDFSHQVSGRLQSMVELGGSL